MSQDTCPVFQPSEEEFCSFREYVERLEREHPGMGICKIIPPPSWKLRDIDIQAITHKVTHPVSQNVSGKHGVFQVELLENRTMTAACFKKLALKSEYVNDDYHERERRFWKYILGNSGNGIAIYGADVPGSLFDGHESHPAWNLNNLDDLLRSLPVSLPGVNSPMLYFGSWRAMFAFHVEDVDLYSINYVHTGAAKSWYSIAPKDRRRFEQMAEKLFPTEFSQCHEFLRHKTKMFSPQRLSEERIPFQMALQHAGEFVITFPGSYHAGFNHGFNIAEATNFAFHRWLDIGRMANVCSCASDSVRVDVNVLETIHIREIVRCLKNNVDIPEWAMRILPPKDAKRKLTALVENLTDLIEGQDASIQCLENVNTKPKTANTYVRSAVVPGFGMEGLQSLENRLRCVCHYDVRYSQSQSKSSNNANDGRCSSADIEPAIINVPSKLHSDNNGDLEEVQCQDCWMWFHPECVRYYYSLQEKILPGMELAVLDISRCHVCHTIELFYSHGKRKRPRNSSMEKGVNKQAKKNNSSEPRSKSTPGVRKTNSQSIHQSRNIVQAEENQEGELYFCPLNNNNDSGNKRCRPPLQSIPAKIIYSITSSFVDNVDR